MKKLITTTLLSTLLFTSCSELTDEELKPDGNDSFATAQPLDIGDSIDIKLYPVNDLDYFEITVDVGTLLHVKTDGIPNEIYPLITFYDENGYVLSEIKGKVGVDIDAPAALKAGSYFVKVQGYERHGIAQPGSDQAFKISFLSDSIDTLEYNNTFTFASLVSIDSVYNTKLLPSGDVDYYKFELTEGSLIHVKTDGIPNEIYPRITFYDENENKISEINGEVGVDIDAPATLEAGSYFVKVQGYERHGIAQPGSDQAFKISFTTP